MKTIWTATFAIALMAFAFNINPAMAGDHSKPWASSESVDELEGLDKDEDGMEVARYEPDCRWKWQVDPNTGNWGWVCQYYSEGEVPGDNVAWDTEPGGNVHCWQSVGRSGPITVCAPDDAWNSENGKGEQLASWMNDEKADQYGDSWFNEAGEESKVAYRIEAWCEVNPDLHAALCANDWFSESGNESEVAYRIEAWCDRNPELHAAICANDWFNESGNESEFAYRIEAWCDRNPELHAAICANDWFNESGNESEFAYRIEAWCDRNPELHAAICANDWFNESGNESKVAYRIEAWCEVNPELRAALCDNDWWKQSGNESKVAYRIEAWCDRNPELHAALCANDWWQQSGNQSEVAELDGGGQETEGRSEARTANLMEYCRRSGNCMMFEDGDRDGTFEIVGRYHDSRSLDLDRDRNDYNKYLKSFAYGGCRMRNDGAVVCPGDAWNSDYPDSDSTDGFGGRDVADSGAEGSTAAAGADDQ